MKTLFMNFLTAIETLILKIKTDLEVIGSALWPAIEQAFDAAEQSEISLLIPIAENIINGINSGTDPKTMFAEALAALEISIVNSGKAFVLTLATQALTIAIDNLKGSSGTGNGGTVTSGTQTAT